ncbi:MAG: succinylglutamate desuccinylase/aspartoacylase family protein [Bdellovibrionales bacterium]|nr:succinylglutamate desuccinylase/aspartoacylase family protein [Bdellovibrionales bacterium]
MFKVRLFGTSSQGLPILSYCFGQKGPVVLILGGVHGDEPEGNYIALGLLKKWIQHFPYQLQMTLIPCFNIEGSLIAQRKNQNKVDLNRNLPTKNWTSEFTKERYQPGKTACSEPENKALVKWIQENSVKLILSLHSWNPMINTNGNCLPEAEIMRKMTGYKLSDYIGYPTPGSLGDYCGQERDIPVITYEAQKDSSIQEALTKHVPAIEKALFSSQKRV